MLQSAGPERQANWKNSNKLHIYLEVIITFKEGMFMKNECAFNMLEKYKNECKYL